ncbi:MAG: hypothetical protein L6V88_02775 [Anaerotruncus sp.]|nr:MAG: hypothetical protein L6V88_02775 [Anaerotruncus sp.]
MRKLQRKIPGLPQRKKSSKKYLKGELEQWADKVEMEDFSVHPAAFMGWIPAAGCIGIISVIFFWLTYKGVVSGPGLAIVATVFVLLALACLVIEFLMYREFVDFLFPRKVSRNVMARRAPSGEVKKEELSSAATRMLQMNGLIHFTAALKALQPLCRARFAA